MRLTRECRERKELIERQGCIVLDVSRKGGHMKFDLELPGGYRRMLVTPMTAGDHRADKNMVARVRRWVRDPASNVSRHH